MNDSTNRKPDIEQLNNLLEGEISAVETYTQCIDELDDASMVAQLHHLKRSHEERRGALQRRIEMLGGQPAQSSGAWGSFAKLVEGGATTLGTKAAVSALQEGEKHGMRRYERIDDDISADTMAFVQRELVPEQRRTAEQLHAIQDQI